MLKYSAYDEAFSAIFRNGDPYFWLVVHECLHPYGHKRYCIVVVRTIDMSVCGYLGVHIGFLEEQ